MACALATDLSGLWLGHLRADELRASHSHCLSLSVPGDDNGSDLMGAVVKTNDTGLAQQQ